MEYTKDNLAKWLRAQLVDLVKDIDHVRKSDMPEFNQGLEVICAFDTKVAKILEKLVALELYEALKEITELAPRDKLKLPYAIQVVEIAEKALSKAEGK